MKPEGKKNDTPTNPPEHPAQTTGRVDARIYDQAEATTYAEKHGKAFVWIFEPGPKVKKYFVEA